MDKDFKFSYKLHAISYDYFFVENPKKLSSIISNEFLKPNVELIIEIAGQENYVWEKNIIQNIVIVKILYVEKEQKYLLAESHTAFDFLITKTEDIPWWGNQKDVPEKLLVTFRSVSYSTTRGLLLSKLSNTYLNSFILPLIDINLLGPPNKNGITNRKEIKKK